VTVSFGPSSDPVTVWENRRALPGLFELASERDDGSPRRSDAKRIVHSGAGGGGVTVGSGDGLTTGDGDGSTAGLGSTTGLGSGSPTTGGSARMSPASPVRPLSKAGSSTGGDVARTLEGSGVDTTASGTARARPPFHPHDLGCSTVTPPARQRHPRRDHLIFTPLDDRRRRRCHLELTASGTATCLPVPVAQAVADPAKAIRDRRSQTG
jgi:hypothetical protein